MTRLIATFGGVGDLRPAPGTWGSLAALPFAWALHSLGGFWAIALGTLAITVIGWWAVERELAGSADKDPSEIVIDEVAGQFIALWPVSLGAPSRGSGFSTSGPGSSPPFSPSAFSTSGNRGRWAGPTGRRVRSASWPMT
jgi:phosphatidylglycerophosphatase A